ncbi:hypothetical protein K2173_018698 [Erythroxylum novogranatense]|uniref:HMA domain-containing protein n=1 Tax=Erythroxylum novogranatense TaxID=1862640 RepID=A0AAV8T258_9ROSI|nr:hypothetical protein K2173_018698 [Erythroxylum novogranatense]
MIMRVNLDCNACCRKARKILLNMKVVETHMIDKQQRKILVRGRFRPADVAIRLGKKMNRRVEILEIEQDVGGNHEP